MKKTKILFFMVALLSLTGMAFFSSCSSDEDSGVEESYNTKTDDSSTYTITFDGNGGKTSGGSATVTQSAKSGDVKLNANTFTRSGYTFLDWAKSADSTKADYTE